MRIFKKAILILLMCNFSVGYAGGPLDALMNYSDIESENISINRPHIITEQGGGYITGGSILYRGARPKNLCPFHIQTPSNKFDACSGSFDFRFPGISYISHVDFANFLKKVSTAAAGYAIKMLIKTYCPQCETVMSELESIARDINNMSLNQCKLGESIAGGMISRLNTGSKQKCQMQSNMNRNSTDLSETMQKCDENPDRHGSDHDEELKSLLGNEFNVTWKALTQDKENSNIGDKEFLEFLMSISGTLIGKKDSEGKWVFTHKSSLFTSPKQIEKLIVGSKEEKLDLYKCEDEDKCLKVNIEKKEIKKSILDEVERIITDIQDKIYQNTSEKDLTSKENFFIKTSSFGIINLLEQNLIQKGKDGAISNYELLEVLCYDVIVGYLGNLLEKTNQQISTLELGTNEPGLVADFKKNLVDIKREINSHKHLAYQRVITSMQSKEIISNRQKQLLDTTRRMYINNK